MVMGGHGQRWGPHPARRGGIPPSVIHGGESWWRRGERLTVPSRPNRTGTGPAGWIPGGRAGLGTGALVPGSLAVVGRRGGDRAGPWAAADEGGRGRAGLSRGRTPRGPWGLGEGSRGRPFLGRGGRGGSLPGERRGPLLSEGGGGRVLPGVGPCLFMAARHGTISPTLRAGVPLWGVEGGGGLAVVVCTHPRWGGLPVGAPSGLAEKNPAASPGLVGPFEEEPRIRQGGLRYMVWYGMVCCSCCCCCCGTQHVPAGEIARHALLGQGAREQSVGVTLAGRVPTTTGGGGGGRHGVGRGAASARGVGRGHTCVTLEPPPRPVGGECPDVCEAAVEGVEGWAGTLGWGRHAWVRGHSAPCPNIPPRWPFLVCGRGVAGGAGPCV